MKDKPNIFAHGGVVIAVIFDAQYELGLIMKRLVLAALVVALLSGCGKAGTPQDASGDTPVRYVICEVGDKKCFVSARFDKFENCQSYKQVQDMGCDRISVPGQILCKPLPGPRVGVAYCTQ